jgi:hypothetical protein
MYIVRYITSGRCVNQRKEHQADTRGPVRSQFLRWSGRCAPRGGTEVTFRAMKGMGHGSVGTLPDYVLKDIVAFFRKTLGPDLPD